MGKISKALTWNDLADEYDKANKNGQSARTLPMDEVFEWIEKQSDKFVVTSEGTIHKIKKK